MATELEIIANKLRTETKDPVISDNGVAKVELEAPMLICPV